MKNYFLILCCGLFALTSCVHQDDVSISSVDRLSLKSLSKPEVMVTVENCSARNIQLKEGHFVFRRNGRDLLQVITTDKIVIPKCSETTIDLPLRMKASDPLAIAAAVSGGKKRLNGITVTGEITVKAGMGRKKIKFRDKPVSQIISIFGIE